MKPTLSKITWVASKVIHYSKLLQISPPYVFLTMQEYDNWKETQRKKPGEQVGRTNCYGVCHREQQFIVVLIKRRSSLESFDDTLRHELIHYAKPSYNHYSKEFRNRMELLKQGKITNGRFYN